MQLGKHHIASPLQDISRRVGDPEDAQDYKAEECKTAACCMIKAWNDDCDCDDMGWDAALLSSVPVPHFQLSLDPLSPFPLWDTYK